MAAGKRRALPPSRRIVGDLLAFARGIPRVTVQRTMQLQQVAEARAAATPKPGWASLFAKAYGTVARENPVLRQSYLRYPWPHVYEHHKSVAMFSIERTDDSEPCLYFAPIMRPDEKGLAELNDLLRAYKEKPLAQIEPFRLVRMLSRWPAALRMPIWWLAYHVMMNWRCRRFGTFGVSAVAAWGAETLELISPLTSTVNYSPLEADGSMRVRLTFDHRLIDGAPAARYLEQLEDQLRGPILNELCGLGAKPLARRA